MPFRYETGPDGFILSGPKYFKKFHDIMLSMVTRYGVNMFKVDGIGFEGNHTVIATEMEGMLNLVRQLRHRFGPFFAHFSAPRHPACAVYRVLLGDHADRVLVGAWNPML